MTKLLIARHGNTFDKGDILLRVGKRTNIHLSSSGKSQAILLGKYLANEHPQIDKTYTSCLHRTQETAKLALNAMGLADEIIPSDIFDEIDYGPDEGMPEDHVIARVGEQALKKWDSEAIAPEGWLVDIEQIKKNWQQFANTISNKDEIILVVTSNGTARFAPYILDNADDFITNNNIKLSTGAISCLSYDGSWQVEYWNRKPKEFV